MYWRSIVLLGKTAYYIRKMSSHSPAVVIFQYHVYRHNWEIIVLASKKKKPVSVIALV